MTLKQIHSFKHHFKNSLQDMSKERIYQIYLNCFDKIWGKNTNREIKRIIKIDIIRDEYPELFL